MANVCAVRAVAASGAKICHAAPYLNSEQFTFAQPSERFGPPAHCCSYSGSRKFEGRTAFSSSSSCSFRQHLTIRTAYTAKRPSLLPLAGLFVHFSPFAANLICRDDAIGLRRTGHRSCPSLMPRFDNCAIEPTMNACSDRRQQRRRQLQWMRKAKDDDFEVEDDGGFDVIEMGDFDEEDNDFKDYETEYETPVGYSPVQIEADSSMKPDGESETNVVEWKIDEDHFHKISLLTCDFFIRKVPDPDNDVYDFREIYVSPPDTDIYSIPKTDGRLPSKPIRCNKSNYEYVVTSEPPVDEPRTPLAKTEYEVMKVFLMRHLKDRRSDDDKFVLDFEEIYVIDSKTRSLYRADVKVEVPGGRRRDRHAETLIVRDDGTTFRIILEEDESTPDQIVQAVHWERTREEMEQYLRGFRDYEVSNWF